jgi:hypothetical protein
VSADVTSFLLAMTLLSAWLFAMITGNVANGLVHVLLALSVGIALVRVLYRQRRQHYQR